MKANFNKYILYTLLVFNFTLLFACTGPSSPVNSTQSHQQEDNRGLNQPVHISHFSWGEIRVQDSAGSETTFRDCKITSRGAREWNWSEVTPSMHHNPGVRLLDVEDILDSVDIVILTQGVDGVLQVPQSTVDSIRSRGKEVHVLRTPEAVRLYNRLTDEGRSVGGLFHSTC